MHFTFCWKWVVTEMPRPKGTLRGGLIKKIEHGSNGHIFLFQTELIKEVIRPQVSQARFLS